MKVRCFPRVLGVLLALSALSAAAGLSGTVKNGTTGKPSAGDDVVLLELSQGMQESARTRTDAQGRFRFQYKNDGSPRMVRVDHQGVNYFVAGGMVPPDTKSVEITVYDAAPKVQGVSVTVDMMRLQAQGGTLQVTELFAVKNASQPPRTQMSDTAFEFMLPEDAQVQSGMASGPGGQPVNSAPVPQNKKNRYAFVFPVRPGETRFQLSYQLPYSGEASLQSKLLYPTQHVVVMLPKSMQFASAGAAQFQPMGEEQGALLQVATDVKPGQDLAFKISGTGTIQETQEVSAEAGQPGTGRGRPGGGLGAPEETPDPLHQYRWFILGGLGVVLALGVFYVVTRPQPAAATAPVTSAPPLTPAAPVPRNGSPPERVLEVLKEELFQLELERHQGRISQDDYEKTKAALDVTIARAAARKSGS